MSKRTLDIRVGAQENVFCVYRNVDYVRNLLSILIENYDNTHKVSRGV